MLKYSEFSEAMMPQDQHFARLLGTKKLQLITKPGRCPFDFSTLNKYLYLWELIIENEKSAESIRQKLLKRHRFDIRSGFYTCNLNRDGCLTLSEVIFVIFILLAETIYVRNGLLCKQ